MNIQLYDEKGKLAQSIETNGAFTQVSVTPNKNEVVEVRLGINIVSIQFVRDAGGKGDWTIRHNANIKAVVEQPFAEPKKA